MSKQPFKCQHVCRSTWKIPPIVHSLLQNEEEQNREWAKVPAWGQLLYNHVILKLVLSLSIGKVLTIFLHIQNAIHRIRIPRHRVSSQLQLPDRHETDMSKRIWPVSSHHAEFRVRKDTGKWWALGKQEQKKMYCNCAVSQDGACSAHVALLKTVKLKGDGKLLSWLWVSNLAISSAINCPPKHSAPLSGMPWYNSPKSKYHLQQRVSGWGTWTYDLESLRCSA